MDAPALLALLVFIVACFLAALTGASALPACRRGCE
jgi:glycerol uptake facilitator-like aquaporin